LWGQEKFENWRDFKDEYEITDMVFIPEYNYLACGLMGKKAEGKVCIWSLDNFKRVT
jgi:hypothetical protein